jgi:RND family efflux transporter MFP subunit
VSEQEWEDANAEYLQALANVNLARAQVRTADIRLRYTDVLAPISGRIGKSACTQGSLVTANQPDELAVIQQLDPVYVDMTQSALNLLKIRERYSKGSLARPAGASAKVQALLETGAVYEAEGELKFSDITVDQGTGMVLLRAVFPNPDGVLLPGMYVTAELDARQVEGIVVPAEAIVYRNGINVIWTVDAEGKALRKIVKLGVQTKNDVQITEGLEGGETVIVEGQSKMNDGDKVLIVE